MPTTPITPIPPLSLVRNPLQVYFQDPVNLASANDAPTEVEIIVQVEDVRDSDTWRTIGEILNPYGTDDRASAFLHKALMGALATNPPSLTASGIQTYPNVVKRFRLLVRDVVDGIPSGAFHTLDPASAWLAGLSYVDINRNFVSNNTTIWLNTTRSQRTIHPSTTLFLNWINISAAASMVIEVEATYTDGTTELFEIPAGAMQAFTACYTRINPAFTKPVQSLVIYLRGYGSGVYTPLQLTYKKNSSPFAQEIFYANSLGGYDNFILTGKSEFGHTDTGEAFETQLFPPLAADQGNFMAFNQESFVPFTLRSGWVDENQRRAFRDMTLRNEVYLRQGNNLRKLIITNSTYEQSKDGEFLYKLEFSGRFAHTNQAYSRVGY
jgi:hypothetical protein